MKHKDAVFLSLFSVLFGVLAISRLVGSQSAERPVEREVADVIRHLEIGGFSRTYLLHVPETLPAETAVPLVLVFHGGGSHAATMPRFTRFDALADRRGFIVAYPEGVNSHWNDTRGLSPADDVAFVRRLIVDIQRSHRIDTSRIYATGISNGGFFAVRLACDLAGELAAVAAVAATMPETLRPACKPVGPISVMFIQGTNDPLVKIEGGVIAGRNGRSVSLRATVDFWTHVNHTAEHPSATDLPDRRADGTHVRQEVYRGALASAEVFVLTIIGGGHTWPGSVQYLPVTLVGRTSANLDATEAIWAFFERHHR